MIVRNAALLLLLTLAPPIFANEESAPSPTPRPGIFHRAINIFHKDKGNAGKADKETTVKGNALELTMAIAPQPLKLSEGHKLDVMLSLANKSTKLVQLEFPTTQRVEVLLRNQAGKLVAQWSEDQSFANDVGYVTIDPHEHLEYTVTISGRDLVAGQTYTVEGFFPNYEKLRVSKTVIPQR